MQKIRVGIIGCGCIGSAVGEFLLTQMEPRMELSGLFDKDPKRIADFLGHARRPVPVFSSIPDLVQSVDLVIEAASVDVVEDVVKTCIDMHKDVLAVSVGGLLGKDPLFAEAEKKHVRVYVPSGAICGIDAIQAFPVESIRRLSLTTTKSPHSLTDVDVANESSVATGSGRVIFDGTAQEAIKRFPKNINVSALLVLASRYPHVRVCIKEDSRVKRNIHQIEVESDYGNLTIKVENVPSAANPKTSYLTILSVQSLLRKIVSYVHIGS